MLARSLLAALFGSLMAVIVAAGGCATGGGTTDDGGSPPPGLEGSTETSPGGCTAPQIKCGKACVDPQNDNANCGGCMKPCGKGEVCSAGLCGLTCSGSDTLCSGAPYDGGVSDESGTAEAGDAGSGAAEGGKHDAGKHDAGKADAGAVSPYCANLTNDPKNCGDCGRACNPEETCESGTCVPHCKKGQTVCPGDTGCKGPGECCSTADCTNVGETCPFPGGTCSCPPDEVVCAAYNTCIKKSTCCTTADCKDVKGSTCPSPGDTCTCPPGQIACTASGSCIPSTDCCTSADCTVTGETCTGGTCSCPGGGSICAVPSDGGASSACIAAGACCPIDCLPPPPNVMTTTCVSAVCTIMTCDAGYVDVDGTYADGCECKDDGYGKTCATITDAGTIAIGGKVTETGVLPLAGEENWFEVDFNQYTATNFAAQITITPSSEFLFNVYTASCSAVPANQASNPPGGTCQDTGGSSLGLATWAMSETDTLTPIGTYPTVGTAGVVYIEVYRASGSPTCDSYTLTITD